MNNLAVEQVSTRSVMGYFAQLTHPVRRADCAALLKILENATGCPPWLCADNSIGFGRYTVGSTRSLLNDTPLLAFASRKNDVVVYTLRGIEDWSGPFSALIPAIGRIKVGRGCLYIKRLKDVDIEKFTVLLSAVVAELRARHQDVSGEWTAPNRRGGVT